MGGDRNGGGAEARRIVESRVLVSLPPDHRDGARTVLQMRGKHFHQQGEGDSS